MTIRWVAFTGIVLIALHLNGQNQIWYFGDHAGIDFNTSPPTPLTNGQLNTGEGCSSISDLGGNLLFYTDGIKVWNRNHVQMPNGYGLLGNSSTTQGALIVPDPADTSKFYIFTIDQLAGSNGMRYSKVDMSLQNGNGDVTTKNTPLHPSVAEKMVAVRRCDGNIWIISHEWNSNKFFADLVTPSGINSTISSSVGTSHSGGGQGVINAVGAMAISSQGNKVAVAMRDNHIFEVLDFNIATGSVSNPITLNSSSYFRSYGVEFSPDGTKLYGGCLNTGEIFQFDLSLGTASAIMSAAVQVANVSDLVGALKLAPDGKIYVARAIGQTNGKTSLAVINSPNTLGSACNFVDNSFYLGGKHCLLGLPNQMVYQKSQSGLTISGNTSICAGDTTRLIVSGSPNIQWIAGSNSTSDTIFVSPNTTTTYSVRDLSSSFCGDTVSITVTVGQGSPLTITASDTAVCPGDSVTLNVAGNNGGSVQWGGGNLNSTQTQVKVSPSGTTKYYVSGGAGKCAGHDTITIYVINSLAAAFTQTPSKCGLDVDFYSPTIGADTYQWDFGDNASAAGNSVTHTYPSAGTYRVRLFVYNSSCNLTDSTSQMITVSDSIAKPEIEVMDQTECSAGKINFDIKNTEPRYAYSWDFGNGESEQGGKAQVQYQDTGTYLVTLTVADTVCGKVYTDTATVYLSEIVQKVFIPNVFTPNGDGLNELFAISGSDCGARDVMEIYNRWGSLLFRTDLPYEVFWDGRFKGRDCSEGVYYYFLFTNNEVYKGFLSLVR